MQLQLLWAAPDGSGPPTSIVHTPDQRGVPPPCPLARPLASTDSQTYNPQCGPVTGLVCASDTCCGRNELFSPVGAPAVFLRQCGNARLHCQVRPFVTVVYGTRAGDVYDLTRPGQYVRSPSGTECVKALLWVGDP